jgi:uncharacterized paraquat-inducible protein A
VPLTQDWIRNGRIVCPYCGGVFEAMVFHPPERRIRVVEVATAGPEGANACANHARNAAVTSCQRCGLLICSLCDMNIGEGSLCPSCFERIRAEGTSRAVVTRYRDYTAMARLSLIGGFLFSFFLLGIPLGALAVYYAIKGAKQRRAEGSTAFGAVIVVLLGVLEMLGGLAFIAFIIWGATQGGQ